MRRGEAGPARTEPWADRNRPAGGLGGTGRPQLPRRAGGGGRCGGAGLPHGLVPPGGPARREWARRGCAGRRCAAGSGSGEDACGSRSVVEAEL